MIDDKFLALIEKLSEACSVPGYEQDVAKILSDELRPFVDELHVDPLGNVIGFSRGSGKDALKVMVETHTDEPALNVKYLEENGFVRPELVGLPLLQALPFERVDIHGRRGPVLGVVGAPGFHIYFLKMGGPKGPEKPPRLRDLFVDIGARSRKEAEEMGVYVGAPVTYHRKVERLGGNLMAGKALDDRALCALMIEAAKKVKEGGHEADIYFVGAVREEAANMGGGPAALGLTQTWR